MVTIKYVGVDLCFVGLVTKPNLHDLHKQIHDMMLYPMYPNQREAYFYYCNIYYCKIIPIVNK